VNGKPVTRRVEVKKIYAFFVIKLKVLKGDCYTYLEDAILQKQ